MPITPVRENPPPKFTRNSIDWTAALTALTDDPGVWYKIDGPLKSQTRPGRQASFVKFAEVNECRVEAVHRNDGGEQWIYARVAVDVPAAPKTASTAPPSPPSKPPSRNGDFGGTHECDGCGEQFRTNTRLRQHQANAHKAS